MTVKFLGLELLPWMIWTNEIAGFLNDLVLKNKVMYKTDFLSTHWCLIDAPPPLINFSKFFQSGHSYLKIYIEQSYLKIKKSIKFSGIFQLPPVIYSNPPAN